MCFLGFLGNGTCACFAEGMATRGAEGTADGKRRMADVTDSHPSIHAVRPVELSEHFGQVNLRGENLASANRTGIFRELAGRAVNSVLFKKLSSI